MFIYESIHPIQITEAREALLCARLNLRGAKRHIQKGSFRRGISALYDSVLFGMIYHVARHERRPDVHLMSDAAGLFHWLMRLGVFEDQHAFNRLSLTVERLLWQGSDSFEANAILAEVEEMLRKLGVLPFQKSTLLKKSRISQ
jgi:hypothetical protein